MAIARTVQLRDKSEPAGAENADDEADDAGKKTARMAEEFMGGDHDIEAEADMDEADFLMSAPNRLAKITLEAATFMLRREDEVAAAKKKGRHREADLQMKAFANKFEASLNASLPQLSPNRADPPPRLLGSNTKQALAHQQAVRNAMRKDQEDLRDVMENASAKQKT